MNAQPIFELLTRAELLFWLAALGAALTARMQRQLPAFLYLTATRAIMAACYDGLLLLYPAGSVGSDTAYSIYFPIYWALYFASTVASFFSIEQLLREAFLPLPGLSRLAVFVFRFTGGLCLFIALTAHLPLLGKIPGPLWLQALAISIDLCICVFEIALVSILLVNARRIGLSLRTRAFGLSLGFLIFGAADIPMLVNATLTVTHWWLELTSEAGLFAALAIWVIYLFAPNQERGPVTLKPESTLMRWNEIVNQLGGQAPVTTPPMTSFMSEVEVLVERIMRRNGDNPS